MVQRVQVAKLSPNHAVKQGGQTAWGWVFEPLHGKTQVLDQDLSLIRVLGVLVMDGWELGFVDVNPHGQKAYYLQRPIEMFHAIT